MIKDSSMKDSIDAIDCIPLIPIKVFDGGYVHFSFDTTLLFTNVPSNKIIKVILHIYKEKI